MKRKLQLLLSIIVLTFGILALSNILSKETTSEIEQKRLVHEQFLANSPFKNTDGLTKMERLEQGLPPTKYLAVLHSWHWVVSIRSIPTKSHILCPVTKM